MTTPEGHTEVEIKEVSGSYEVFTEKYWGERQTALPLYNHVKASGAEKRAANHAFVELAPKIVSGEVKGDILPINTYFAPYSPDHREAIYNYPGTVLLYDQEYLRPRAEKDPDTSRNLTDPSLSIASARGLMREFSNSLPRPAGVTVYTGANLCFCYQGNTYIRRVGLIYIGQRHHRPVVMEMSGVSITPLGRVIARNFWPSCVLQAPIGQSYLPVETKMPVRLRSVEICEIGTREAEKAPALGRLVMKLRHQN